ncbi:MAG: hypothetical protein Q9227_001937 [Pyrenula ochraceoflavens]
MADEENPASSASSREAANSPRPAESVEPVSASNSKNHGRSISQEQSRAFKNLVELVQAHRVAVKGDNEHDPSGAFRRLVNRRNMPEYYEVIKEPMALSTIKKKFLNRQYTSVPEVVRDFALITHNAQIYNRPNSGVYKDALEVKSFVEAELEKLVEEELITREQATFPDLGEIPYATPEPDPVSEEEDEEEEEDDEDEEPEDSDDEKAKRGRRRGRRSSIPKRNRSKDDGDKKDDQDARKRRGRPPRVDTPMEARIKAILKGIRKFKSSQGYLKVANFEKLPDKSTEAAYYATIKEPIAIDLIKKKSKRKKYESVEHFMRDMDLMFNNAKLYNEDDSEIFKDAVDLQKEAHKLAEEEKAKPDSEYLMEDGRMPLPDGILHNGELFRIGDWVHIQNPNDVTKPIVAQVYRTWQDTENQKWVNACWYYRPEQTVHRFDKHFFPSEVVKTGQYTDHRIDEVVDRCFVMFHTRFNRGRPRGLDPTKEVYVCEARYNEQQYKLNKIKTWASCLPDEVREKDYEMELFDVPKKIKKLPSPIKHLLKDDQKETDDLPEPTWGAPNAPPIIGAVHRRPRDENDSPPPEPTPPPPPTPPPAPVRQASSNMASSMSRPPLNSTGDINGRTSSSNLGGPSPSPQPSASAAQSSTPYNRPSASPAPSSLQRRDNYSSPQGRYTPQSSSQQNFHQAPPPPPQYTGSTSSQPYSAMPRSSMPQPPSYPVNAPRSHEAFVLPDTANASIPPNIRAQFQQDDQGRILFFTTPPLDILPPTKPGQALGHTPSYLVAQDKREQAISEDRKRKFLEKARAAEERDRTKRARVAAAASYASHAANGEAEQEEEGEEGDIASQLEALKSKALQVLVSQIQRGTQDFYEAEYGEKAADVQAVDDERYKERQVLWEEQERDWKRVLKSSERVDVTGLRGSGVFKDDYDARY